MGVVNRVKESIISDDEYKKAERRLLRKLDFFILTYSCLSYFFNYLDRSAFANAYVAGLREDLNLHGNQFNILLSVTTAGLVIGQIPNAIALQKIAPRIWLPSMVLIWAGLTMCSAACKTYSQLVAVRFFMGLVEGGTYTGCIYVLGSWYTPKELAKRTAIITVAGQIGTMFAGVMMTAIHKGMEGYAGLKGWQWVFLIDGIITCPVAIMGLLTFPDTPEKTRASYLSPQEREMALSRVPPKRKDSNDISPLSLIKRVFATPTFYCLILFSYVCSALQAFPLQSLFLLWMKAHQGRPFTQTNVTTYPLGIQGAGVVVEFAVAWYLDKTGHKIRTGIFVIAIQLVCAIILVIPNIPYGLSFFAFYLSGSAYAINPLLYGWANIICIRAGDDAQRAIIISSMGGTGLILWTFWGIALYPASDAPYWRNGCIAMICVTVVATGVLFLIKWLDNYTLKKIPEVNPALAEVQEKETEEKIVITDNKGNEESQKV